MKDNLPTIYTRDLVSEIAMDIGKEVVFHIEQMYPAMFEAVSKNAKLSVRNCIHNEIMAAIKVNDAGEIEARLVQRKKFRRHLKGYKNVKNMDELVEHIRKSPI